MAEFIQRTLDLPSLLEKRSFFLFGPRATGKTSLIKQQLGDNAFRIDLLRGDLYLRLSGKPWELQKLIPPATKIVVIDEVQRVPELLNEVHRLIEEEKITFLLTGSSARKLRERGVNLLAGRALEARLFPLTSAELQSFELARYLLVGGIPEVYLSDEPFEILYAYVDTYLKEEIQAEMLVRKLPAFSRFLQVAAIANGQNLNFAAIGSDIGIASSTVKEYYRLLEDTLIGFMLPAWTKTKKRKAISRAKFYFFDLGVKNTLCDIQQIERHSDLYGLAFEHFIGLELRAYLSYRRSRKNLCYWRTKHGDEVDFIVGDELAIEVKSTKLVHPKHLKGLQRLKEEGICRDYILVSQDETAQFHDSIKILYWRDFLTQLWADKLIKL